MATKAYAKELTRVQLEEMGICNIYWDEDNQEWWIDRYWKKKAKSKEKTHQHLKITSSVCKHKYSPDVTYPIVGFSYLSASHVYPLARVIWAWFKGKVNAGMVIDHIDNNKFNCRLDNLQEVTPEINIRKRYIDNPGVKYFNQYTNREE